MKPFTTLSIALWCLSSSVNVLVNAATPTTEAVCQSGFGWMSNSKAQSPCLVAAYLEGACGTGYFDVPALPSGNTYDGPNENQTNLCLCSSVVYTAVSACGACQGGAWVTWPVWKLACDDNIVTIANYKFDIPPGTAVPRWMYQDPTQQIGVTFNNTLAYTVASEGLPDVTSSNQVSASGTTSAATTSPTASSTSGGSKSVNVGAVVGGVVGGLGFLTAIAVIGWVCLRRRRSTRSSQAPSKQYIAKWSKEVPAGQAPSRWGGTSYGSDSVMGDPQKDRDLMMSPTSTLPSSYPYGTDGHLGYANGKPSFESHQRNRSMETVPQQAVAYYHSSPPSAYPGKKSKKSHKKDHSGSGSFSKILMGKPTPAENITPFYLPAAETTVTSDPEMSMSPSRSDGRPSYSIEQPSPSRSRTSKPSRKVKSPILAEPLPSTIEYFQNKPPPLPNTSATAITSTAPSAMPYGRSSTEGNRSRSSFTGSRAGYYNPDDPTTYPTSQSDGYGRAPSSRRTSADQLPSVPISQQAWPDAAAEKAALAGRDYTPQTMGTPGHSGYSYSQNHYARTNTSSPPMSSTSPYGNRSRVGSPLPAQPLVGASLGLGNSVHTIQGYDEPEDQLEQPAPQHQRHESMSETETAVGASPATGFFSGLGRRMRPGGRSNESNASGASQQAPGRQFSIHVRNSQFGQNEFNPYGG